MSELIPRKTVKKIKVDLDKCLGCRSCEVACSGLHATPKHSSFNPARSRIRVITDLVNDVYVPVRGGDYAPAECSGRQTFTIKGKEYSECSFCSVSCPARDLFREPDNGLPLKCDMCEGVSLQMPLCVEVCRPGALTYEEIVVDAEGEQAPGDVGIGVESLIRKYGYQKIREAVDRLSEKR